MADRICRETEPVEDRKVTITFDPEDLIDIMRVLPGAVCPKNLAPLGHALITASKGPGR
jgi:hypothetical protein